MKKIRIFDTTLRDGEQAPGCSMHVREKMEIAKMLALLNVDAFEAGFAASSEEDFQAVSTIAKEIKGREIATLCRSLEQDIDIGYKAIKSADSPMLHIFLATSPIHMQYKLKMEESEVLESIAHSIAYAKKYLNNIQFSAEDATRSNISFLAKALSVAIKNGATSVNIADTVGYTTSTEISFIVKELLEKTDGIEKVNFGIHCHNDLGMAVSNTLSAIQSGVNQCDCTINGIGERSGNASLEEVVMALKTRQDIFGCETQINTRNIYKSCKLVSGITGMQIPVNKAIVGANAFAHESGIHQHGIINERSTYEILTPVDVGIKDNSIILGKHSGRHAFCEYLKCMGYEFSEEEEERYFQLFKLLAEKKKFVSSRDIQSIIAHNDISQIKLYQLKKFNIDLDNAKGANAKIILSCKGEEKTAEATGNGAVDAAFKAISIIIGKELVLKNYSLQAVTEGKDALGEATVRLADNSYEVLGRGVSTDIIEASILAYLDGANKLTD